MFTERELYQESVVPREWCTGESFVPEKLLYRESVVLRKCCTEKVLYRESVVPGRVVYQGNVLSREGFNRDWPKAVFASFR